MSRLTTQQLGMVSPMERGVSLIAAGELGNLPYVAVGGREYGKPYLDAVQESLITWERLATGARDQAGNVTTRQKPAQILPRIIYEVLQRFEGRASDWPVDMTPIPETEREEGSPRDRLYDVFYDFLEQCRWSRATGCDLALADNRAYVKMGALERAAERCEVIFDALTAAPRLSPDKDVVELREQVRTLQELVDDAREKGFSPQGQSHG